MSFPILDVIVFLPLGAAILVVALLPKTAPSNVVTASAVGAAVVGAWHRAVDGHRFQDRGMLTPVSSSPAISPG
jgi:hypothetical protein